jgi:hemerythrin-like domain-containing protein
MMTKSWRYSIISRATLRLGTTQWKISFSKLLTKASVNHLDVEELLHAHPRLEALSAQIAYVFDENQAANTVPSPQAMRLGRQYHAEQISHIHAEHSIFSLIGKLFSDVDGDEVNAKVASQFKCRGSQSIDEDYILRCESITNKHVFTGTGLH